MLFLKPGSTSLRCWALALTALPFVFVARADTLALAGKVTPQTGFVEVSDNVGLTPAAIMFHNKSIEPPLSMDLVDAFSGATVNASFGLLRASSSVFATLNIDDAATQGGQVDNTHWAFARIGDTIRWSGMTDLELTLDLDWTVLSTLLESNTSAESSGASTYAGLGMSLTLEGIASAVNHSRTFLFESRKNEIFSDYSFRLVDGNGAVLEQGDQPPSASFMHTVILPATGVATDIGLTIQLDTSVACTLEGYQGWQKCQSGAVASNTGYLQIAGDFTSLNGYAYPGRNPGGDGEVPEPATVMTTGVSLSALALLALRKKNRSA